MKPLNFLTSACRYCQYYQPEGRRGGICQQLGVPVQGRWKACALALPAFAPSWEGLEDMMILPDKSPVLSDAQPLEESRGGRGAEGQRSKGKGFFPLPIYPLSPKGAPSSPASHHPCSPCSLPSR